MDFTDANLRFAHAKEQLSCELGGEIALLNLGSKLYFGLTDVAAAIWREFGTPKSLEAIIAAVAAEYDVEVELCRKDVLVFLADMRERGLLEVKEAPE